MIVFLRFAFFFELENIVLSNRTHESFGWLVGASALEYAADLARSRQLRSKTLLGLPRSPRLSSEALLDLARSRHLRSETLLGLAGAAELENAARAHSEPPAAIENGARVSKSTMAPDQLRR